MPMSWDASTMAFGWGPAKPQKHASFKWGQAADITITCKLWLALNARSRRAAGTIMKKL